jgi:hypothetical protein
VRPQPCSPIQPGKGMVTMRAPIPPEDRTPPVSRVIAEALVRRQGPSRIVTRATRLGLSPVLTRAVVVACAASALDSDGIAIKQRPAD